MRLPSGRHSLNLTSFPLLGDQTHHIKVAKVTTESTCVGGGHGSSWGIMVNPQNAVRFFIRFAYKLHSNKLRDTIWKVLQRVLPTVINALGKKQRFCWANPLSLFACCFENYTAAFFSGYLKSHGKILPKNLRSKSQDKLLLEQIKCLFLTYFPLENIREVFVTFSLVIFQGENSAEENICYAEMRSLTWKFWTKAKPKFERAKERGNWTTNFP